MKKFKYILALFLPMCVSAQVGIGTDDLSAGLEIKTNPTGIPALRLEPQSQPIGSKNGQLAVIDNLLFMYDEERTKWLSVERTLLEFGRLGLGSDPSEIEFGGGDLQNGPRMPFEGTIVGISMSATEDDNSREIGLYINGIGVPNNLLGSKDGVFTLDPTSLTFENNNYNLDFTKGDMISMALLDANVNDIDNLIVTLNVKWRKENP